MRTAKGDAASCTTLARRSVESPGVIGRISNSASGLAMEAQDSEICAFGVSELGRLYRRGELSPVEATKACLERIKRLQPILNAYLSVTEETALASARVAEQQFRAGIDVGPVQGIPVSVKDIIRATGTRTTAASRLLQEAPPDTDDATVTKRLRASGAVLLGKLNLHEFAYGDPDPDGPFGVVQNPRRLGHQCGGSSSGCGAATAAGLGVVSFGTDTGGSIRHPAAVCGVYGLKPTYGLVPLTGVIPLSPYLDTVGPLGRSVADVAAGLAAIAGFDRNDRFSAERVVDDYGTEPGALQA
jgi:aspartyl-tRNA(Asn)/glutamyl-tRNA(Gln) amidotransferase subunit A